MRRFSDFVLGRINQIRKSQGLEALEPDAQLDAIARSYSRRMALEGFMGHQDPGGENVVDRLREAGVPFEHVGENIFRVENATSLRKAAQVTVDGWMDSPGHRENILRGFSRTGMGAWRRGDDIFVTQIFLAGAGAT
jgi:uncharacterized protein YkwD